LHESCRHPYYVDAVEGEMSGQVLRAWGGLDVPAITR